MICYVKVGKVLWILTSRVRVCQCSRLASFVYFVNGARSVTLHCALPSKTTLFLMLQVWTFQSVSGTYAECVQAREDQVVLLPDELSFEQGAALGIPYMTAYRALVQKAQVKKGETVLVHGASGGAGVAGVQIAKGLGCNVIGTAGTLEGIAVVERAGVSTPLPSAYVNEGRAVELCELCTPGLQLPISFEGGAYVEV